MVVEGKRGLDTFDCVAATSAEEHENAIKFDYPMFSDVMTSDALTGELGAAPVTT